MSLLHTERETKDPITWTVHQGISQQGLGRLELGWDGPGGQRGKVGDNPC